MRLYIAEKPSLGRAIATALAGQRAQRRDGHIHLPDGDCVSWCIGHLLEQAEPEAYDPAFKRWSHDHLPIVPDDWQLKPKKETAAQLKILRKLIREADELVHAGDPDREGQLLVDEVLHYASISKKRINAVKRCLINDLNPAAIRRSLTNLRPNREFLPLSTSALARSRADWLYGINMTRAYTLQGQKVGYQGVLSVGRVQTPVLGLVVRRDLEIANFVSQPYFEVWANLTTEKNEAFRARWIPSDACKPMLDDAGRNLSKPLAENVVARITDKPATVKKVERKKRVLTPPLPYNLSALQMDANRAFGLSAQAVLDACQSLYEKHQLITYPRSDCRYLPEDHYTEAPALVEKIQQNLELLDCQQYTHSYPAIGEGIKAGRKTRTWDDKRVSAHHAIIPTLRRAGALSGSEKQVYQLISRQYLGQFLPDHEFFETRAEITIESGLFVARAKEPHIEGWKLLFARAPKKTKAQDANKTDNTDTLPNLSEGQSLHSGAGTIEEKKTTPPAPFTEATLLSAMTGISQFVSDKALKKVLRETDGLGTEATRAGIIELLIRRQFIERQQKNLRATPAGIALVEALPSSTTLPDMTARWESCLTSISQGAADYDTLMQPLITQLRDLATESRTILPRGLQGLGNKYTKKRGPTKKRRASSASPGKGLATSSKTAKSRPRSGSKRKNQAG
ncbi:MAG: DNA topoisomerase III [Gammaproteobacteria bacterium]|nr:DNA topoisomerase III [Gammaproteobacteria bacterium]